ncbi:maltose permease [Fusarium albosuccineum]|uniref:Maltose permease n=1 Tax=Fusarium albosuccineum TaxID=1237068 RepID=A0A8H4L0E9_9HYPO|nr:maltose permease [Fusarium albosuccineum]
MQDYDKNNIDLKATPSHASATVEHDAIPDKLNVNGIDLANTNEHNLSFRDVAKKHPKIIWWSFFWCMCAVGSSSHQRNGSWIIPARWLTAFNVVSSVGQFFGGFACSYVSDRMGRKKSLTLGVLVVTGGIFGETFSSRTAFVVSKFILGVGVGFYLTLGPITCSEIAPTVLRGLSTAGVNLGIAIGQLVSNSVTSGFGDRHDVWAFRAPFLVQLFFSVFLIIGSFLSPESPWYLVRAGKMDEAGDVLRYLYGSEFEAQEMLSAVQQTVEEESRMEAPSYVSAFKGANRIRTLISIGVFACQHAVGIIFVLSFSTYFFQLAGLDTQKSLDLGVGVTACGVAGNICSWFIVNRFGRRPIFISGMFACTAILLLIGILDVVPTGAAKWAQSSLTVIFSFVYFMTIGAVAFVLLGEVSSLALRARTTALATATQAIFGIIMFFAVPYMVNPDAGNLVGKVGFVFGGLSSIASAVCFFYIPELKQRSYQEIDAMFLRRVPPRQMGSYQFGQPE